jgi:hypothetical protein
MLPVGSGPLSPPVDNRDVVLRRIRVYNLDFVLASSTHLHDHARITGPLRIATGLLQDRG